MFDRFKHTLGSARRYARVHIKHLGIRRSSFDLVLQNMTIFRTNAVAEHNHQRAFAILPGSLVRSWMQSNGLN